MNVLNKLKHLLEIFKNSGNCVIHQLKNVLYKLVKHKKSSLTEKTYGHLIRFPDVIWYQSAHPMNSTKMVIHGNEDDEQGNKTPPNKINKTI